MVFAAALASCLLVAIEPPAAPYRDHALVLVDVPDASSLRRLLATGVDPWLEHPRPGVVPVLVSPQQWPRLAVGEWTVRVIDSDVQRSVDDEQDRLAARPPHVPGGAGFFADFRPLSEIDDEIDALAEAYPEVVTVIPIGESIQGRTIRAVRLSTAPEDAPSVIVTSGQHSREWIAVSSGMYLVSEIAARSAEPEYAQMLATIQVLVLPMVNPDGYEYSWVGQRYWRKNRRNGVGVDINRNFGRNWGGEGASGMPMDENYAGTAAFSEPETVAVRDFVLAHPEAVAHLDVHSFGQLILYPWGDVFELAPDDDELSQTAAVMEAAMEATGFQDYLPIQGVNLYPASGNAIDWTYDEAGLHALTLELRPQDPEVNFVIPPDQIVPVGEEVLVAAWVLFDRAMGDSPDPTGEDTGSDTTTTSSGGADTSTTADTLDPSGAMTTAADTSATVSSTTIDPQGTTSGSDEGTSGAAADGDAAGCGCTTDSPRRASWLAGVMILLGLGRRRVPVVAGRPG
jgi:MYXO-CTERM domain-containing protein